MPVKPLSFKGDPKKSKKRKHRSYEDEDLSGRTPGQEGEGHVVDPADDDSWTIPDQPSDLTGPTVLVLPTNPPTCLASDAHGNVFASQLENIVESYGETAEPHDVRQVWVASTVAGTGQISFKASHGGYLSCDSIGVLGAKREARGTEEGFVVEAIQQEGGRLRFRLRTAASKLSDGEKGYRYISASMESITTSKSDSEDARKKVSISIRGDGEVDSGSIQLVLKMQARFKPRLQQNKETKAKEKVSRRELEQVVGRRLDDEEVKRLKKAKKNGTYYEEILDVRVKGKHDKFAS